MTPRAFGGAVLDGTASATPRPRAGRFAVPGQRLALEWRRNDDGRLVELRCGARRHLVEHDGVRIFGDRLAEVSELRDGARLLRVVHAPHASWVEEYRTNGQGRLCHVDGVDVERDAAGRIVAAGAWRYRYHADALVDVQGPRGSRRIERDARGRALSVVDADGRRLLAYDEAGRRTDVSRLPGTFHRDDLGRLWTVTDEAGRVVTTYLWEGTSCLARIDGDVSAEITAVFSLDPTGTPVRVVERDGHRRIPRDAFGEGLLAEQGVPGLFGAAVHVGLFYLPARALDPRTGMFCSPDPWNAGPGDPRRVDGRDIPLAVEVPGDYVVCRHDPIGRTDPTGCTSGTAALVAFSSLTWASPTTIFGILGFDLGINFWLSLFSGQIGDYFGSFGDGMAAKRHGGFGVRRGGLLGFSRAYTIGHYVMHDAATYKAYDLISCFAPKAAMPLVGYGTLLQLTTDDRNTFLLDGSTGIPNGVPARGWTRGGGVGTPVYPGATVARYDAGGLHIDHNLSTASTPDLNTSNFPVASTTVFGPQGCTLTELAPTGVWAAGFSLANLIVVTLEGTALAISVGDLVALTHTTKDATGSSVIDSATIAAVLNVAINGGSTELTLESSGSGVLTPMRLRTLGPPGKAENASAVAGKPAYLSTAGTTAAYAAGDPLRLSQAAGTSGLVPVGAAVILRLEAQLAIDAALPASTALSFTLVVAGGTGGPITVASSNTITCTGAVPPVPGIVLLATANGTVPVATTASKANPSGGQDVTLDRSITLTGGGSWTPLVANGGAFGSAQQADGAATLTYQPAAPRTAPAVGSFVRVDASNAATTVRVVTGVNYDALVLSTLPGNAGAAYSVERFPFLLIDQDDLTFTTRNGFDIDAALTPKANQTLPGVSLRLHELAGPTLAAAASGVAPAIAGVALTVKGASLTATLTAVPPERNPAPGQLMLLSNGAATLELTVVTGLRLTVTCDRAWTGPTAKLEAIPIGNGGPAYPATAVGVGGALTFTLANSLPTATGPIVTEMPRFSVGELVQLAWKDGASSLSDVYRISSVEALLSGAGTVLVDSATITLSGGSLTPSPTASAFTVTRQVPQTPSPSTGSSREGLNGDVIVPAGGGNPQMRFSVWSAGSLAGTAYAVTDGTTTLPMRFVAPAAATPRSLEIQLGATPVSFADGTTPTLLVPRLLALPGPSATPPPRAQGNTVYAASFTQTGNVVNFSVHADELNVLPQATGNIVVAVSFGPTATAGTPPLTATNAAGTVQPGTVLIPEDTSYELTVKEGLVEHETRHTMQYSWLGPLMWGVFPILPFLDKVYPGLDAADFSPYFDAQLTTDGGASSLRCSNLGTTKLEKGDKVMGALNVPTVLGERNAKVTDPAGTLTFLITAADYEALRRFADADGRVSLRKRTNTTGGDVADGFLRDFPVFLTPGGATEFAVSSTWGWFIYGLVRLFYALGHQSEAASGLTYPGTVSGDGLSIHVTDDPGRLALADVIRVLVQFEKSTVIRTVSAGQGDTPLSVRLTMTEALADLKGKVVQVAPWDSHQPASAWDWNHYYPATVPDKTKPATINVKPADSAGTDTLTLALQDIVEIRTGSESKRTVVSAVNADGTVDLEDPPQMVLAGKGSDTIDKEFRVAKVGEHDPLGSLGGLFANLQHAPWLGKLVDPWAWIFSLPNVKPGSGGEWAMRVLRWIGSSHAWSMIFPGVLWIDDLFKGTGSFSAWMEQDASENSGDLYTSLGRLQQAPVVVGDIGRYWFFPNGRYLSMYMAPTSGRPSRGFDTAGAQINREAVVSPLVAAEATGGTGINKGAGSPAPLSAPPSPGAPLPVGAGDAVPDALFAKAVTDPRSPASGGAPSAFVPTDRGLIPLPPALERSEGTYVAYTRPGTHRATIIESFLSSTLTNEAANARSVVDTGAGFGIKDVTLFFNQTIADLTVTIGGVPVNNDDTVTLVLTQTVKVQVVAPVDASRRYALTLQRPLTGRLLQADQAGSDPTTIQVQAPAPLPAVLSEPVELSRIYRYDAASDAYDEPSLNTFKMNLPGDLRVPVRRFTVQVTGTLTARSKVSQLASDDVTSVTIGTDVFVLVPTSVTVPLSIAISYPPGASATIKDPVLAIDTVPIPADLVKAGVSGTAFKVSGNRSDPPEAPATVAFSVGVGAAGLAATLTGSVVINPAFELDAAGGFTVARGATLTLTAHDLSGINVNVSAVDPVADVTIKVTGASIELTVAATAAPGARRILATLASDASGATRAARTITIT